MNGRFKNNMSKFIIVIIRIKEMTVILNYYIIVKIIAHLLNMQIKSSFTDSNKFSTNNLKLIKNM